MNIVLFPWLEGLFIILIVGSVALRFQKDSARLKTQAVFLSSCAFICAAASWIKLLYLGNYQLSSPLSKFLGAYGEGILVLDRISAPIFVLTSLLFLLTVLSATGTEVRRFHFALYPLLEALTLGILVCSQKVALILLVILQSIPIYYELSVHRRSARAFVVYMALSFLLLVGGLFCTQTTEAGELLHSFGYLCLTIGVLIRSGGAPFHCWVIDLFQKATISTSILYVVPMIGSYLVLRLIIPDAPPWALRIFALSSMITAVYAAGMTLVQKDARGFYSYLLISNSSLMLVGIEVMTPNSITGALSMWLSIILSLSGFGLVLRSVESRTGRLSLTIYNGLYQRMPRLASFFLIMGLASVGFPGTVGFIGSELIIKSALIDVGPYMGVCVLVSAAINGIAVLWVHFRIFTGKQHVSTFRLYLKKSEWIVGLIIFTLVIGGGLYPQLGIRYNYDAAKQYLERIQILKTVHKKTKVEVNAI